MKNSRQFTPEEIIKSKGYNKGMMNFATPANLLEGTLDIEPKKYEINVQASHEQINVNEDKSENVSFGRLNLQYTFKLDDELSYDLGLVIALDKGKPIAKIYNGVKVNACLNMCIFGAEQIIKFDNISISGNSYKEAFKNQFKHVEERVNKSIIVIEGLKKIKLKAETIHRLNGAIISNIIANNGIAGTNPILNGIKLQNSRDSKYFSENGLNAWLYFNSLTEYLEQKTQILDIPEKALNIFNCVKEILRETNKKEVNKIEENQILVIN